MSPNGLGVVSMQVYQGFDGVGREFGPTAVAMGNYDGVHVGHARILADVVAASREAGLASCVLTFFPHPLQVLAPERAPAAIQTLEDRLAAIEALGIDATVVLPFTRELAVVAAEAFVSEFLVARLRCAHLFVGPDARFGHGRGGDLALLRRFEARGTFRLSVTRTVEVDGERVSSSGIRRLVMAGDVARAARWLGRPYVVSGRVVHGDGRGQGLGFPTANVLPGATTRLAEGIYAVIAEAPAGRYAAAVHVGPIPTFGVERPVVEAHLLDFEGDLVDTTLRLHFLERLRDVVRFPDAEALRAAIADDVARTRAICRERG
jgi:riboflavin kinase/FMN adenylyltransferase